MRILLSAFAFGPGEGSESGSAWTWANHLAEEHEVVVVTDGHNLARIGAKVAELKHPRLTVLYFRPWWCRRLRVTTWTSQLVFGQWQLGLMFLARRLHRERPFDLLHHISYGAFRQASWLGFVGPPAVFGPVGGGEDAPWRFKRSLPVGEKLREIARAVVNRVATLNPFWRWALSRIDLVFARTPETLAWLPQGVQQRAVIAQETGAPAGRLPIATGWSSGQRVELIFAGRLLGLKGVQFAIGALAELIHRGGDVRLTIIGSGPMEQPLRAQARRLGLADAERLLFIPFLPQAELFKRYAAAHVLMFPSLRDAGGNVVQEALSAGLPVVCLNLGGPPSFVDDSCGRAVPARDASDEDELVLRLADAVQAVTASTERWHSLHRGALARANELTWDRQIDRIQAEIAKMLASRGFDAARQSADQSSAARANRG